MHNESGGQESVNLVKTNYGHAHVEFLGHVMRKVQIPPVAAKWQKFLSFQFLIIRES